MIVRSSRILMVALCVAIVCIACDISPNQPGTAPEASPAPFAPVPSSDPGSNAVVTITFGAQQNERAIYEPLIASFNQANPGIQVQFVAIDTIAQAPAEVDQIVSRVVRAADTGAVFGVGANDVKNGYLFDLSPLMDVDATFDRNDFYPGALQQLPPTGGIYLLPRTLNIPLLAYNRDLLAKGGVGVPALTWTWGDLRAAAEQLAQKRGDTVTVYGLLDWNTPALALSYELEAAGMNLRGAPDSGQVRIDDPKAVPVLEQVAGLVSSGALYSPPASVGGLIDINGVRQLIRDQRVGIWSTNIVPLEASASEFPFTVGVAPYPEAANALVSSAEGYIMSSGTQHPQEAWRWLSFLSQQTISQAGAFVRSGSQVPARKSLAESSGYWSQLTPDVKTALEAVLARSGSTEASAAMGLQFTTALSQAVQSVVSGDKTAQQALSDAQATLDQIVAQAPDQPAGTPVVVATPDVQVAPAGATTITFDTWQADADQIRRIAQAFQREHPDIFVRLKTTDVFGPTQPSEVAQGADCYAGLGPSSARDTQSALDLQPLSDADPSFDLKDYPTALLDPFRRGDGLYGLPYRVAFRVLHYDPAAFDAAGVAYPTASWSMDDLLQAAQQLTSGSPPDQRYGFASLSPTEDVLFVMARFGATATQENGATVQPNFTDPKVSQALRWYLDLLRGASPQTEFQGWGYPGRGGVNNAFGLVSSGRVSMWLEFGEISSGQPAGSGAGTIAIAPPPLQGSTITPADFAVTVGLYISATSQQAPACWEWLKFLSNDPAGLQGGFPGRRSVAESQAFIQQAPPGAAEVYAAYREALDRTPASSGDGSEALPVDPFWFYRAVDRAIQGRDLERELADAQLLTEQYLVCLQGGAAPNQCATQVDSTYTGQNAAFPSS